MIDHTNGNPSDDRWSNLRQANYSTNGANSKRWRKKQKSTPKGVTFDKARGLYAARIKVNYKTINLGRFKTRRAAHAAYMVAARTHFGEFARPR